MRTQFALQGKEVVYKSMGSFISHTYNTKGIRGKAYSCAPVAKESSPYSPRF